MGQYPHHMTLCPPIAIMKSYGIIIIVLLLYIPGILYITLKSLHFHITCLGCPRVLRTDAGTENCILAMIQPMLRHKHIDCFAQEKSHMYGRSTSNQVATVFSIQSIHSCYKIMHTHVHVIAQLQIELVYITNKLLVLFCRELRHGVVNFDNAISNGGFHSSK